MAKTEQPSNASSSPFVDKAMALLKEREQATTQDEKDAITDRLAALIRANVHGQSWTVDGRQRQTPRGD